MILRSVLKYRETLEINGEFWRPAEYIDVAPIRVYDIQGGISF